MFCKLSALAIHKMNVSGENGNVLKYPQSFVDAVLTDDLLIWLMTAHEIVCLYLSILHYLSDR